MIQLAIPYALFARGLRSVPAPEAGLITLIEPILNPMWVLLVQREQPRPATLVGGLFLVLAVAVRFVPLRHWARGGPTGSGACAAAQASDGSLPLEPPGAGSGAGRRRSG